ncbi:hypothetical protein AVEN_230266-1 [Araneus ventricosus]|uniref:Uncharacterized protein n=1 Tax=Araneus ventricosus TaxID=182803 RepID=A0A4Y2VFE4_ARAVE|nr:hypothetical protein AVEN_230266-1 [Araneus ventricosus]
MVPQLMDGTHDAHSALWQQYCLAPACNIPTVFVGVPPRAKPCSRYSRAARALKKGDPTFTRLQTIWNSNPSIPLWQFSLASHTPTKGFSFPCSKNQNEQECECPWL